MVFYFIPDESNIQACRQAYQRKRRTQKSSGQREKNQKGNEQKKITYQKSIGEKRNILNIFQTFVY